IRDPLVTGVQTCALPISMPMRDLRVTNVGPFDDITFEFDEHINIFVGPNSSGKSTALMALADIAAYPFALPGRLRRQAPAAFTEIGRASCRERVQRRVWA